MEHEIDLNKMSHFPNDIKKEVYNQKHIRKVISLKS